MDDPEASRTAALLFLLGCSERVREVAATSCPDLVAVVRSGGFDLRGPDLTGGNAPSDA